MKFNKSQLPICIIGCGVSGLTCGITLLENGYRNIRIISKQIPSDSSSDVAAALWRLYSLLPEHLAKKWAKDSLQVFAQLCKEENSGVSWINYTELYQLSIDQPDWMDLVQQAPHPFIPTGYQGVFTVRVPLINMTIYMPYLYQRFLALGGIIEHHKVSALEDLQDFVLLINCSGFGAKQLGHDRSVYPLKGQVIRLTKPSELTYSIADNALQMIYIIPRQEDCIVGCIAEERQWDLAQDSRFFEDLLMRAIQICPALSSAQVIETKIGLRAGRPEIRLEAQPLSSQVMVIHNYGHGNQGVALSWGCARRVLQLTNRYALDYG